MRGIPGEAVIVVCKICKEKFATRFAKDGLPEETRCRKCSRMIRSKQSTGTGVNGYEGSIGCRRVGNKISQGE